MDATLLYVCSSLSFILCHPCFISSQEVFNDASSGDKEAMAKVEAAVNEKLFPGINTSALKVSNKTFRHGGGRKKVLSTHVSNTR